MIRRGPIQRVAAALTNMPDAGHRLFDFDGYLERETMGER
jgi:hypothetical protein